MRKRDEIRQVITLQGRKRDTPSHVGIRQDHKLLRDQRFHSSLVLCLRFTFSNKALQICLGNASVESKDVFTFIVPSYTLPVV